MVEWLKSMMKEQIPVNVRYGKGYSESYYANGCIIGWVDDYGIVVIENNSIQTAIPHACLTHVGRTV